MKVMKVLRRALGTSTVDPVGGDYSDRPIWTKSVVLDQCKGRLASFAIANPPLTFGRLLDDEVTVQASSAQRTSESPIRLWLLASGSPDHIMRWPSGCRVKYLSVLNNESLVDETCCGKSCAKLFFRMERESLTGHRPHGENVNRRVRASSDRSAKRDFGFFMDVYDEPGHLIRRAQQIAVSLFHSTMHNGVTPIQYCVLRVLQDHPGIDQVTLARLSALDTSTAADLAVRLEERGLVRRVMPMKSKRYRLLQLTPEGTALVKRLLPSAYVLSRRMLRALNKKEQRLFLRLLKKFVHLNNLESRAPLDRAFSRLRYNNSNFRAQRR